MPRLKFLSKPLAKIRQHRHETKAALLTTEFGWHTSSTRDRTPLCRKGVAFFCSSSKTV
jgi:hypothetical protein